MKNLDREGVPYILITTHAIEVGCDLDSEILITDFCNPDQLIQRAGRCARHKNSEGKIYIIGNDFTEKDEFLKNSDMNYEKYVEILDKYLENGVLPQEKIRKEIIKPKLTKDELSDALFNYLSAFIYDFDRNREELHNSGFVVTRSWTPSVKFYWLKDCEISDLRNLFAESTTWTGLLEYLKRNNLLHGFEELSISLELLASKEIDKKNLKDKVLIAAYSNSKVLDEDIERPLAYFNINPYIDDIFVFYSGREFPNNNPLGTGLINVPKIFVKSHTGIMVNLKAVSETLLDKNKKLSMRYLVPDY
jgi:CRISPR/Cas system-associated endonuclease/helicase Cas3